jgi:hypothetical protein
LNGHISKEEIQMAKKYMKKMLSIIFHRGSAMKTGMKYHLDAVRTALLKK